MKYTDEQIKRSVKKLARALGRYNCSNVTEDQRRATELQLFREAMRVVNKFGLFAVYQKEMRDLHFDNLKIEL